MNQANPIRGRFAPSPSGEMHLGNAWTALLAWLQIRALGGTMVLRIEDLDPARCRPEYTAQLIDDLRWLGLDWDEGPDVGGPYAPYSQAQRRSLYAQAVDHLSQQGLVYPCYCTRAELHNPANAPHAGETDYIYPGTCPSLSPEEQKYREDQRRKPALRLAVPQKTIQFTDGIYGQISQNLRQACGDFIIRRADGIHAYQLAVVADDAAMGITHILRGADLLSSTPRQLLLYCLLGVQPPCFTHVPLLCGTDGHRLSKRQKDLSLSDLRKNGFSAAAIIGYLAYKANLQPANRPVSPHHLIEAFTLTGIPRTPQEVTVAAINR